MQFSAHFIQLLVSCSVFKDIILVETCSNVDSHGCVVHENTWKTPAVGSAYVSVGTTPESHESDDDTLMIPLSSKVLVDGAIWCNHKPPSPARSLVSLYCGMPPKVLDTVPYSDSVTFSLLTSLCMISGRSAEQAVQALGHHLIVFSLRSGHGRFLKAQGATLPIFLQTLGCIMELAPSFTQGLCSQLFNWAEGESGEVASGHLSMSTLDVLLSKTEAT